MKALQHQTPSADTVGRRLADLVDLAALGESPATRPDPRIIATIDYIQRTVTGNPSLSELADHAGLSRSRLANLFKNQVGVPIRRYRLWHRLFVACTHLASGSSITDAAYNSGFSDAAHLSHTFREILGIAPSDQFGNAARINVVVEPMVTPANRMA